MKEENMPVRYFFSSKGDLPWIVVGGCSEDWQLSDEKIEPYGPAKEVRVWQNTKLEGYEKEWKD